ncbi:MAG: nucleotidyltransferase [Paramuribaculum sp.]|nr:nucleotidyltransferase [Paramuribaculum sp.]
MDTISTLFDKFIDKIQLTSTQRDDAKTKYTGVCKTLYNHYYGETYHDGAKYLFGSYKTKTNITPIDARQDVDVLFKINETKYIQYKNNPSGLLQEIRSVLKNRYVTTEEIKAWGKVVLIRFAKNHHNVELLPGLEQEDGTFLIPCTEKGGYWELFDPRAQVDSFNLSNSETGGITRALVQMFKKWVRNTSCLHYKSFHIVDDVIDFLNVVYENKPDSVGYETLIKDFFTYMENNTPEHLADYSSHITTAKNRANKAIQYAAEGKMIAASDEWRKIFGSDYPRAQKDEIQESKAQPIINPARPWGLI